MATQSKVMVQDHDFATGEVIKREATTEELESFAILKAEAELKAAEEANKLALIESRNAKLLALGLTPEELNL